MRVIGLMEGFDGEPRHGARAKDQATGGIAVQEGPEFLALLHSMADLHSG